MVVGKLGSDVGRTHAQEIGTPRTHFIYSKNWRPQLDCDDAYQNHIRQQLQITSRVTADTLEVRSGQVSLHTQMAALC